MENGYYNTNKECGVVLGRSNAKAKTQEDDILVIFRNKKRLSASQAWALYDSSGVTPLTSIRRAITNLCRDSRLIKTDDVVEGIYGKNEHIYKFPSEVMVYGAFNQLLMF
jgi:hypothetical protein